MAKVKYKVSLEVFNHEDALKGEAGFVTHSFLSVPSSESAILLTESYRGTIDWEEGDDEVVAEAELRASIDGKYGQLLSSSSFSIADASGRQVAQIVTAAPEGEATILFIYCHPDFRGKGLASHLIVLSAHELLLMGYKELHLYVTEGNPAERLYQSLGFGRVGEGLAE